MPDFIGPFGFILLRVMGALLFFALAHKFWIKEKIKEKKDYYLLAVSAFFGVATNMLCFFKGLSLTSPINASIIMTVNPVIVLLFSAILLKERVGWIKVLGIALGMTGAILQIIDPFGVSKEVESINWRGDLLILVNAASYAVYLVMVKPLMAKYHAFTVVKWTFTFGLLMVIPFGLGEFLATDWASVDATIFARLLFVVLGTTFLAYLLNAWALRYVNSSVVGVYIYLQPLIATVFAVAWAGYKFNWFMLVYASLIFAGVYLVSFKFKTKAAHG
jgi:drug/metabolite transporter (DMT)-like permease